MDYTAFGEEIGSGVGQRTTAQGFGATNNFSQKYGLTERDKATGLDHAWFRKNENRAGRWTSPDPYNGSMTQSDPQSFNRYAYVGNDPINFTDPTGLYEGCIHEAMTKFLGRLSGLAAAIADKIAYFAGDGKGAADSDEFAATSAKNYAKCLAGRGPSVTIHFPSAAQLAANKHNYANYVAEKDYQNAGFMIHSIEDAYGAHLGYSNVACLGHATDLLSIKNPHEIDRIIGDNKFTNAANAVFQVMSKNILAKLTPVQIKDLIKSIKDSCGSKFTIKDESEQVSSGGGGGGAVTPVTYNGSSGMSDADWAFFMLDLLSRSAEQHVRAL